MGAILPSTTRSTESYALKNPNKHFVYTVAACPTGSTWLSAAGEDTTPAFGWRGDSSASSAWGSSSSGTGSTITAYVTGGGDIAGTFHTFDGRRLGATGGTGAILIANYANELANKYQNKKWLTFDFPAASSVANAETWTSALRAEVFDWAWQETSGSTDPRVCVNYVPSTGVFTFVVPAGSPAGILHVWTY